MFHLFKLINSIDNDDTLTIYIEESEYHGGVVDNLGLRFENGDIKQCKNQSLKLIEPDEEELELPSVKFSSVINLPSSDFQKIIRDLSNLSEAQLYGMGKTPAAALGSVRKKPTDSDIEQLVSIFEKQNIRNFFYIGGNDSAETANLVSEEAKSIGYDMKAFHIPKIGRAHV